MDELCVWGAFGKSISTRRRTTLSYVLVQQSDPCLQYVLSGGVGHPSVDVSQCLPVLYSACLIQMSNAVLFSSLLVALHDCRVTTVTAV
jgi:hypothetical protein